MRKPLVLLLLFAAGCISKEDSSRNPVPDTTASPLPSPVETNPVLPDPLPDSITPKPKVAKKDTLKEPDRVTSGNPNDGHGVSGTGPATVFTITSVQQTLSRMESQLNKLSLTGSQDHDYLVKMMALNYQATKKIEQKMNAGDETGGLSDDFSNQSKMFTSAAGLLRTVNPGSAETRMPVTFKTEESKTINHIYNEMRNLSNRIIASSDNPSVVSFAERTVKMTSSALN